MAKFTKEIAFGDHTLILETGEIARQADGAVLARMNGTEVLVTVVAKKEGGENNGFFPLTVNYQEKFYAVGKIPGGFNKREGRPSDNETLISRLIDRPIRPLFPNSFRNEVQVIATVLSLNPEVSSDIIALVGTSAALALSGVPFDGPIGAARVGYKDGIYLLNPSRKELEESKLDLVVAGTKEAILMVESEAKELSEEIMHGAITFGHEMMKAVIKGIEEMAAKVGKPRWDWKAAETNTNLQDRIKEMAKANVETAYLLKDKQERYQRLGELKDQTIAALLVENDQFNSAEIATMFGDLESAIVRNRVLDGEPRIDGRDHKTVRPITIRTKFLERTHGSCLFTRGETQAIVVATLGNDRDAQILDGINVESKDRFMLHYNFPPYSVGETGMVGSPKRRESWLYCQMQKIFHTYCE